MWRFRYEFYFENGDHMVLEEAERIQYIAETNCEQYSIGEGDVISVNLNKVNYSKTLSIKEK